MELAATAEDTVPGILAARVRVDEHTIEVAGAPVFYRSAPSPAGTPPLYLHGMPTSSDDWLTLLERTGGVAPDLIGFGRSGKGGHLDYTLAGLAEFLERLLGALALERVSLVAHDWGAGAALVFAQRNPERIERLVLCDPLPLTGDFRWHRTARLLRSPGIGELLMGSLPRWLLARTLRGAAGPRAFSDERVRAVWRQFDQGTQRAVLRLHRSATEEALAAAASRLDLLTMPTLIIWGELDPWFPASLAEAFGERLPNANVELVANAGHWPWLERADVADRIAAFVG
jgi:pimeloyl-ACP methyl ester carboxylesterase